MFKKQLLILLIICWSQHSSCFVDDLFEIGQKAWNFITYLNDVKTGVDDALDFASFISNISENGEIVEKLKEIDQKLNRFEASIEAEFHRSEEPSSELSNYGGEYRAKMHLVSFMSMVDGDWNILSSSVRNRVDKYSISPLNEYSVLSIESYRPQFRDSFTELLMSMSKYQNDNRDYLCNKGETFHHTLTRLYQTVLITEIKVQILLCLAYSVELPKKDAKLKFNKLNQNFTEQFVRYNQEYTEFLTNGKLPYLRACDPAKWRRGEDFHELEGFFQQTIYHRRACYERQVPECHELAAAKDYTRRGCKMEAINDHTKCDSELYNCEEPFNWSPTTHVCVWAHGPYRIRYIENGKTKQGTDIVDTCPTSNYHRSKVGGFHLADNFCTCQCRSKKWKFIVQLMRSKELENYIIVGMRINRIGEYFCIQIAEGKLEANGHISNFSWVPSNRRILMDGTTNGDFFIADPQKMHAVFFDDLQLQPGHVLTGVQFDWVLRDGIEGVGIIALGRKFNYQTGELDLFHADFPQSLSTTAKKELRYTTKNSINKKSSEPSHPDSEAYTHIFLRQSDFSDDYGQSTLPLFDALPILTNPLSPIGGVGLFHKGNKGYAGFLSLRIYPINYVHFLTDFLQSNDSDTLFPWNN